MRRGVAEKKDCEVILVSGASRRITRQQSVWKYLAVHCHSANPVLRLPAMWRRFSQPITSLLAFSHGIQTQALISSGLIALIAVAIWPVIPAVTAMSLVALGATRMTLQRLRAEPAARPLVLLHLTVYGALYGVFVAASLHAVSSGVHSAHYFSVPWLGWLSSSYLLTAIDLAASTLAMALALREIFGACRDDSLTT